MGSPRFDPPLEGHPLDTPVVARVRLASPPGCDSLVSAGLAAIKGSDTAPGLNALANIHREVGVVAAALNARLLGTALEWTQRENDEAAEMGRVHQELARTAYDLTRELAGMPQPRGAMQQAAAIALHAAGDALKSNAIAGHAVPTNYRGLHALMREAITRSGHRAVLSVPVAGIATACTLEALYFRALLLARFAAGALNAKQVEILDAWIWMWLPVLKSTAQPPQGSALRADLDSAAGLVRGTRSAAGPSLYLPQEPIADAYRAVRHEFEKGHIVPAGTLAASFRIEEHVALLEVIGKGLRVSLAEPVVRAPRRPSGFTGELHVGLAEIGSRGQSFGPPVETAVSIAMKAGGTVGPPRRESERDVALDQIYEPVRRTVRVLDVSDSGFSAQGTLVACGQVSVRDLVGMRLRPDGPLVIGCVARVSPDTHGKVLIGVRRLTSASRVIEAVPLDEPGAAPLALLFVPGSERSGTRDGFLISESQFAHDSRIQVTVDATSYILRFNRVRERGRGWVLAGFAVLEAGTAEKHLLSVAAHIPGI